MASRVRGTAAALVALMIVSGCAAGAPEPRVERSVAPGSTMEPRAETPAAPGTGPRQKSLTVALPNEPSVLALPIPSAGSSVVGTDDISLAVTHRLVGYDTSGKPFPMLAAELPTRDKGTWILRPDGTMRTVYRLRENLTWHDGTPVTAGDFVFAYNLVSNKAFPLSPDTTDMVSAVEAVDSRTVAIEWRTVYPFAGELADRDFVPYPAHLLEGSYQELDPEAFMRLPFWREGFVGTGPYRVEAWESGVQLEVLAYPNFYGGKARIDRVVFRFILDANTLVANLLAGEIDGEIPRALELSQGMLVKRQWESEGRKPTAVLQRGSWRHIFPKFRDPQYPEIARDVRLRRGLLHAIDRETLSRTLLEGEATVSDTFFLPTDRRWDWVKDVVMRYPYDPRRAQELLAEAGWRHSAGGGLVSASGEPINLSLWAVAGQETETTVAIVADYWKELGAQVEQNIIPRTRYRQREYRVSFPSFLYAGITPEMFSPLNRMYGAECPRAEAQWSGSSFGCYQNQELDRLIGEIRTAIDPADQRRLWHGIVKHQTEQLPVLPMYFSLDITLFREGVTGVKGNTEPSIGVTWNIHEWDII